MREMNYLFSRYLIEKAIRERRNGAGDHIHLIATTGRGVSDFRWRDAFQNVIVKIRWRQGRRADALSIDAEGIAS